MIVPRPKHFHRKPPNQTRLPTGRQPWCPQGTLTSTSSRRTWLPAHTAAARSSGLYRTHSTFPSRVLRTEPRGSTPAGTGVTSVIGGRQPLSQGVTSPSAATHRAAAFPRLWLLESSKNSKHKTPSRNVGSWSEQPRWPHHGGTLPISPREGCRCACTDPPPGKHPGHPGAPGQAQGSCHLPSWERPPHVRIPVSPRDSERGLRGHRPFQPELLLFMKGRVGSRYQTQGSLDMYVHTCM